MFKTLGWLAWAMTACAALLAWMEPPNPTVAALTDPDFIRQQVSQAVHTEGGVATECWGQVEIAAFGQSSGAVSLAATRGDGHHFLVSEYGLVQAAPSWTRQECGKRGGSSIVVGLMGIRDARDLPLGQWIGLRALLFELRERVQAVEASPVRIDPVLGANSPRIAQALRELLGHEGLVVSDQ